MTICFFGMYAPDYSRNRILLKGLDQNGIEIIECNNRGHFFWGFRYYHLLKKFFQVGRKADIIFVGFPGQTDVPLAWVLGKIFHKKIVFDAFYSLYCSYVYDRKYFSKNSMKARFWWFIDWVSCLLADRVVLDTNEHIKYFVETFGIDRAKFIRVLVGTDPDVIKPKKIGKHRGFIVEFHGSYLPLQGVPVIIKTAKLLPGITFKLLGGGLEYLKCRKLAEKLAVNNVEFLEQIPYEKLADYISVADVYLGGPFGNNLKSKLVIPNKVYEAMAVGKPVIVGDSAATRELFMDKVHCLLVKQGDPKELAQAISELKKNNLLREKIASKGYNLMTKNLTPKKIGADLLSSLA